MKTNNHATEPIPAPLNNSAAQPRRHGREAPPIQNPKSKIQNLSADLWSLHATDLADQLTPASTVNAHEPLAPRTTMRTGGPARLYAEPANEDDLALTLAFARARDIPILLLGRGSNLLIPDTGVDALVISLKNCALPGATLPGCKILRGGHRVQCSAGLRLKSLCGLTTSAGLAGFEFLEGIPATLGGALRMNAGAFGGEIYNLVDEVRVMTATGGVTTLNPADMGVTYRHCAEFATRGSIALGATLRATDKLAPDVIRARIEKNRAQRHLIQPREPSAGCIFKNPPDDSAGRLIETSGLKGHRIGGAEVSPLHANFIINRDNATTADIIALIRHIRAVVLAKHNTLIEPEVHLFGADWKNYL
jgi:UDP-N-acetylenolpyruvoylglucosamine reductase